MNQRPIERWWPFRVAVSLPKDTSAETGATRSKVSAQPRCDRLQHTNQSKPFEVASTQGTCKAT